MHTMLRWMFVVTVAIVIACIPYQSYLLWKRLRPSTPPEQKQEIRGIQANSKAGLLGLLLTAAFFKAALLATEHGEQVLRWLVRILGLRMVQITLAIILLILGAAAFVFKEENQRIYGVTEISFGIAASMVALQHVAVNNFFTTLVTLGGCVYVVARGFSNLSEGGQEGIRKKGQVPKSESYCLAFD